MADTYDAEIFYRNGKAMVRYPDGDEAAYADVLKYMNPSVDFDPATGEALGPATPPVGRSEADVRAGAKNEPQRRKDQDTFGDTTMRMAAPYFDSAIELAANAGRRPTYFSGPIMGGLERAGQYTGDMALAALSGLGALTYGGAGLLGEVFGGDESSERRLARDLAAGFDVAGVGPEARALGSVARTALSGRGTPETARGFLADESGSLPLRLMGGGTPDPTNTGWTFRDMRKPDLSREDNKRLQAMFDRTAWQEIDLPISRMIATQPTVNADFAETLSSQGRLPTVVQKGNELFVRDGHHRLVKAAQAGNTKARVALLNLDPRTETPLLDYQKPAPWTAKDDALWAELLSAGLLSE